MNRKVLAFGEVMMRMATSSHLPLPQTNILHVAYTGTGLNVLSALSHFGLRTSLVTKLPDNPLGDAAIANIRALGIGTEDISRGGQFIGKYFLEQGFDVRPSRITYSNRTESSFCRSTLDVYSFDEIFRDADMIHFCGITLAVSEQTRKLAFAFAKEAQERGVKVVFDSNYRPKLWKHNYAEAKKWYEKFLPYVDICFMTDKNATKILGFKSKETDPKERLRDLLTKVGKIFNIQMIAGTIREYLDGNGHSLQGFVVTGEQITFSKPDEFQILDRIGGGDGFASGLLYGYMRGLSREAMIEFATASGVLAHTTYGDSPISRVEDVWAFLERGGPADVER